MDVEDPLKPIDCITQPDPRHDALWSCDEVVRTFRHHITHPVAACDRLPQGAYGGLGVAG